VIRLARDGPTETPSADGSMMREKVCRGEACGVLLKHTAHMLKLGHTSHFKRAPTMGVTWMVEDKKQ